MKVYTVQPLDFLSSEEKVILPKVTSDTIFTNSTTIEALNFMKTKVDKARPDLIWVWPRLRDTFFKYPRPGYRVYIFEVPMSDYKRILWSDYIDWHLHLNGALSDPNFNPNEIFNVNPLKAKGKIIQGVTPHLKKEWLVKTIDL